MAKPINKSKPVKKRPNPVKAAGQVKRKTKSSVAVWRVELFMDAADFKVLRTAARARKPSADQVNILLRLAIQAVEAAVPSSQSEVLSRLIMHDMMKSGVV